MRYVVIGAGAIGGAHGTHMVHAGHNVLLCDVDVDAEHGEAITASGPQMVGPVGEFTVAEIIHDIEQSRRVCEVGNLDELADHAAGLAPAAHHERAGS